MEINANFDQRVVVHSAEMNWVASPISGVSRRPLDRVGGEVARATSIVRYDPNSQFSAHVHTGGEEFLVLDGVFQDEHGDYPAGYYVRNPPESSHTPSSLNGCTILVKLWQFEPLDRTHVRLNTNFVQPVQSADQPDAAVIPLYADDFEQVSIQRWKPNSRITLPAADGLEIFVLTGGFAQAGDILTQYCWLRLPPGQTADITVLDTATKVWLKVNHLSNVQAQIDRVMAI